MDARAAAFVHYYAREGYLQHVQSVCNELIKHASTPVLQLWRAYGLLASGATAEALRELYTIQQHPDVGLAATAALLTAHQAAKVVDDNAVLQLSAYLEVEEGSASGAAALHLAAFLFYAHSFERARSLLEKQLSSSDGSDPESLRAQALLGFVLLEQQAQEEPELQDSAELRQALQLFEGVLQHAPSDLEAVLGKARALEATHEMRAAWELLSEASIRLPWAAPVHMELARLTLAQQDWDGLLEVTGRLQQVDSSNVMALAYLALHALLVRGDAAAAAQCLEDMASEVQRVEPSNAALMMQLAACFARLSGSDAALLKVTSSLADKALQLHPDNPHYVVEAAAQQLLAGQLAAATAGFEAALRMDELHIQAVLGLVEAHLAAGQLEEAEQQLQFLPELLAATRTAGSSSKGLGEVQGLFAGVQAAGPQFGFMHTGGRLGLMAQGHSQSRAVSDAGEGLGMQVVAGGSAVEDVHQNEPLLLCLKGLLAWKQGKQQEGLHLLQQGMEQQLEAVEDLPYGLAMFGALNGSRMLGVVRLLLDSFGGDPRQPTDPPSLLLSNCIRVLELLSRFLVSHPEAQLLYARTMFLNGAMDAAARKAANILGSNPGSAQAALLVVSIHLRQGRAAEALAALEAAVSANFGIREAPLYHVVHAQVLMASGQLQEARKVLETAMSLPGVRSPASPEQAGRLAARGCLPSIHERARIFLLLAEVITLIAKPQAAVEVRKLLHEAVREFEGTSEEMSIMVADCEASISAGDVSGALQRLKKVPASSPHYARACVAMAEIHLKHRKDKVAYINCYQHLVEKNPEYESHCMLAEAYMNLHEPDKAVIAYEAALELRPKDSNLAVLAAKACVAAHDYNKAIDHSNRAIRNDPSKLVLQHSLARLLLKLGQERAATSLLDKCLEVHKAHEEAGGAINVETLALDVDTWLLLAKLREQSGDADGYVAAQGQALKLQTMLVDALRHPDKMGAAAAAAAFDRLSGDGMGLRPKGHMSFLTTDGSTAAAAAGGASAAAAAAPTTTAAASAKAATICFGLAEHHRLRHQYDKAEAAYTACVSHKHKHGAARLALARLALAAGQVDACQQHASLLLEDEPDNEDAAIMLAEIMAHQGQHDSAVSYFQKLLDRRPCHYTVLVQLLSMLRRAGKLREADKYIAAAEAAAGGASGGSSGAEAGGAAGNSAAAADGGLSYCKGLLQKYLNNPREALQHFNAARRNVAWSTPALLAMAEVYLNPENDVNWATDGEADVTPQSDADARESVRAASTLLKQLKPSDMHTSKYKVLSAYILMASKNRGDIEAAVGQLLDLANSDANDVPVLMALAHGFLLLKQTAKARNQLKRVSKLPYVPQDADAFERAWLALAGIHVAGGKFDLAQELCARCLKYNRSCSRAWELLGSIAEREQAYKDAASHYEHAWQLSNEKDVAVGYKLAFNYLKADRHVAAIAVAQAVLKADPQYPTIRQSVLEKARAGLKP